MTGALIDVILGVIVFTSVMYAFWCEWQRQIVATLWIDDEWLHRMSQAMKRSEVVMRSFGMASREAAKSFEKFAEVMAEIAEREREMYPLRQVPGWRTIEITPEVVDG